MQKKNLTSLPVTSILENVYHLKVFTGDVEFVRKHCKTYNGKPNFTQAKVEAVSYFFYGLSKGKSIVSFRNGLKFCTNRRASDTFHRCDAITTFSFIHGIVKFPGNILVVICTIDGCIVVPFIVNYF